MTPTKRTGHDRAAWDELVDEHAGTVWAIARSYGLDAPGAASVCVITWLRLADRPDTFDRPSQARAWLEATAHQEALRLIKRQAPPM